uniref:F-box domain-containing protein n=1 Tax=Solanum lycopersicum TaxID=4081 RepID=A0A3Q7G960_SOLLC|nr:F-box/FBD/LRR-repeat protein At1g13570-like [Solanum lycopersicum]
MSLREVASDLTKSTVIGDLPNDILHRILEKLPIKDTVVTSILSKQWLHVWSTLPHFVFDHLFFDHVGASAASIIRKILMQHTESIQGFHLISKSHTLLQSDVDQFIMFVSNHGVEKFTLDMATDWKYVLPHSIFTCSTLTDLKLSRCMLKLPVPDAQFPNLVSLQLKLFSIERPVGSNNATLILPMLETLELMCCFNVHSVNLELALVPATDTLDVSLNLQSLKISDLKINVKCFSSLFYLLRNCGMLVELDLDLLEKVDVTRNHSSELFYYLKSHDQVISEALQTIQKVTLRKFQGTAIEMYLVEVILVNSPNLKRMSLKKLEEN